MLKPVFLGVGDSVEVGVGHQPQIEIIISNNPSVENNTKSVQNVSFCTLQSLDNIVRYPYF